MNCEEANRTCKIVASLGSSKGPLRFNTTLFTCYTGLLSYRSRLQEHLDG